MQKKFILLITLLTLSFGSIAFLSSKESSYRLLDASQLAKQPEEYKGEKLRVRGHVKVGSLLRQGRKATFLLELHGKEVAVNYDGSTILPDAFKEGARVRVDGKWKNMALQANHVEAKCASKYNAEYQDKGKVSHE
ncbi:MAG: cytochrome c maturation protein CcmE [Spirochaetota bacterium]